MKQYALKQDTSLSDLVEAYFARLIQTKNKADILSLMENLPQSDVTQQLPADLTKAYYEEKAKVNGH